MRVCSGPFALAAPNQQVPSTRPIRVASFLARADPEAREEARALLWLVAADSEAGLQALVQQLVRSEGKVADGWQAQQPALQGPSPCLALHAVSGWRR